MAYITSDDEGFQRTATALKLMFGLIAAADEPFTFYTQFGYHGYAIQLFRSHIEYLTDINSVIAPALPEFNVNIVERWKLTNNLLLEGFAVVPSSEDRIARQLPGLAALAAFPVLEEVARLISQAWDEEGKMTRIEAVSKWNPYGAPKPRSYSVGETIVSLSYKLQLMHKALHPNLQHTLESLDQEFQRPLAEGVRGPMSPLYDRLKFFRDQWMHGRRYEGWEALLISLLLALLYFGGLGLRRAQEKTSGPASA